MAFKLVRPAAGGEAWLEADVEVNARPGPESPGRMLSRVRVVLILATEVTPAEGAKRTEFYRSAAEAVALGGGRSHVRFYLPPEIVRRDAVRGEPRQWAAEAFVDGRAQAVARARFAGSLGTSELRRNFVQEADAARINDGVLQPQYLTPFAAEYPNATPTFVRREAVD